MDVTLTRANDLDGSSQLDEILNELLNETSASPKKQPWSSDGKGIFDQPSGSITTQSGNSRTVISWQTNQAGPRKAVTTTKQMNADSLGRAGRGGGSTTWESQTLKTEGRSWKMQAEEEEKTLRRSEETLRRENAMSPSALHQLQREGGSTPRKTVKSPPPPPARRRLISADELGVGMQSSCLASRATTARRSDGEETASVRRDLTRNCASDSEETRSWLDEQRWKLESKRSGKSYQQHSRLEKQLISDLKSHLVSSGKYTETTQSDTEDHRTMSPPRQQQHQQQEQEQRARPIGVRLNASSYDDVSAKPPTSSLRRGGGGGQQMSDNEDLSPKERTMTKQTEAVLYGGSYDDVVKATTFDLGSPGGTQGPRVATAGATTTGRRGEPVRSLSLGDDPNRQKATYKTKASFFVSGIERPAFSTHQTKYTFSVSPIMFEDDSLGRNHPPAPPPRSSAPTSPLIPKRGDSSREAVQRSHRKRKNRFSSHDRLSTLLSFCNSILLVLYFIVSYYPFIPHSIFYHFILFYPLIYPSILSYSSSYSVLSSISHSSLSCALRGILFYCSAFYSVLLFYSSLFLHRILDPKAEANCISKTNSSSIREKSGNPMQWVGGSPLSLYTNCVNMIQQSVASSNNNGLEEVRLSVFCFALMNPTKTSVK